MNRPPTLWAQVQSASAPAAEAALRCLYTNFWAPPYAALRAQGLTEKEAHRQARRSFCRLRRERLQSHGEFPKCLRLFLLRRTDVRLSGSSDSLLTDPTSLPAEDRDAVERSLLDTSLSEASPENLFEAEWARTVLRCARRHVAHEYDRSGQFDTFLALESQLDSPGLAPASPTIARRLAVKERSIQVMLHRLRRRRREAAALVLTDTVLDAASLDEELEHLRESLGRAL